jgi:hypothetical protein
VLTPAKSIGQTRVFAHFFDQAKINNPRSDEQGPLVRGEYTVLDADWLQLEQPNACLQVHDFEALKAQGDTWEDGFHSLRNLVHQLHSLSTVTEAAIKWNPDLILFVRPDLVYHDSLERPLRKMLRVKQETACLPRWQRWQGGCNDRLGICTCPQAAEAYGHRIRLAMDFCLENQRALHAELLLRFALEAQSIRIKLMSERASRLRSNGVMQRESFLPYTLYRLSVPLARLFTRHD